MTYEPAQRLETYAWLNNTKVTLKLENEVDSRPNVNRTLPGADIGPKKETGKI